MQRRKFLKYSAATMLAAPFVHAARADSGTFKVVVIGAKTGPLAPGAAITQFPPFKLWAHEVNERGGLKLKDGQRKIEIVEYDDQTQPAECIKAVERAATVDKADWISGMYATGFNLAAAPTMAKHGYPQFAVACLTDQAPALVKKYPGFFTFQSSTTIYAKSAIGVLKNLKDGAQIGNKVAVVNVADDFGIELANAGRPLFKEAGFEIVYDKSYPLGTQDLSPVIKAAKAANPDAFVAWSYPPDTFGLAEQAKIDGLNVKAYYSAVGTDFEGLVEHINAIQNELIDEAIAAGLEYIQFDYPLYPMLISQMYLDIFKQMGASFEQLMDRCHRRRQENRRTSAKPCDTRNSPLPRQLALAFHGVRLARAGSRANVQRIALRRLLY